MTMADISPIPQRLSAMRSMIARKMHESLQSTAQVTYHAELDARALLAARAAWRTLHPRISYEDLTIEVLARLVSRYPIFNGIFLNGELRLNKAVHVSIAIALPDALVAPVVFDCESRTLAEIASARVDLVTRANSNKLNMREMTGGTITISNMGMSRTRFFTPILNAPQIAILGLGQIAPRPWIIDGQLGVVPVMGLSLTTDHRIVDGSPSGEFLTALCKELESIDGPK
jgi:pyruvate dehydrogenase E2 component (dihydrolipoamide acetyltransferase)